MTDFKVLKVGDRVEITRVSKVEVAEYDGLSIIDTDGFEWLDDGATTFKVIPKPREIGWWEVNYDSGGVKCATLWDGTCWNWSHGDPLLYQEFVHPLHYIGKGSGDE